MFINLQKIIFLISFNFSLFFLLMIGIQNSTSSRRVDFIIGKTIKLPVSFIVGTSFISGSVTGSLLSMSFVNKKDRFL